jgi:uncharacterized membrane protein YfcA
VDISANSAAQHRDVGEYVREEPLTALAIATVAGFVLGGGVNRRIGRAMLTMVGGIALRAVASNLIVGMVTGSHDNRGQDSARPGSETHDNGRTDCQKPG